jgi:hypothetical protein
MEHRELADECIIKSINIKYGPCEVYKSLLTNVDFIQIM